MATKSLWQIIPQKEGYIFDYDNQFIPTEKYDSKRRYKKADGYVPGIASIEYATFGWDKTYRYVISREKKPDGQGDLFTRDDFTYKAIMTNNREMTDLEVILFYNARGKSERFFDEMNNDFLWKKHLSLSFRKIPFFLS